MKFYEALGLEPKLALDSEDLTKRFYERSRQWHPDKFSRAGSEQLQKALDMTAMLNDAFRTLRDPVSRAEYFLRESGIELAKETPPELLEEVFELNMALEELRGGDESARPQLESAGQRFRAMLAAIDEWLTESFARYDACRNSAVMDEMRFALNRRKYISNLVRDVEKELNVHAAN